MKHVERLNAVDYLFLLLIILVFAAVSWFYQINQSFNHDQLQMLLKGYYAAFNSTYLPFGNESGIMGNVPGMLSSWLMGLPLQVYMHPYAPAVFQTLIRAIGIVIFANALSLLFTRRVVLLGTFLFALSPWTLYQSMLYSPAYLTFCAPLVLNCLLRLRYDYHDHYHDKNSRHRVFPSFFLIIAFGMIVQLHFSWPVLVVGALILWLRRDIKVSYLGLGLGLLVVALSLLPYIQEVISNPNLLNHADASAQDGYFGYGLLHVYPLFKGLLYWLRFASFSVSEQAIIPKIADDYSLAIVILCWAWIILSQAFGVISAIIAAYGNLFALSGAKAGTDVAKSQFIRGLTISFMLAVIIASAASSEVVNSSHIALVLPFALIPLLAWLSANHKYLKVYFIASLVFFICANAVASLKSDKFDYFNSFDEGLYTDCLTAFTKEQCELLSGSLSAATKLELQANYKFDAAIYDRIIKGLIPLPDGSLKPVENFSIPFLGDEESSSDTASSVDKASTSADPSYAEASSNNADESATAAATSESGTSTSDAQSESDQAKATAADAKANDAKQDASSKDVAATTDKQATDKQATPAEAKATAADAKTAAAKESAAKAIAAAKESEAKAQAEGRDKATKDTDSKAETEEKTAANSKTATEAAAGGEAKDESSKAVESDKPLVKQLKLSESALIKALPTLADDIRSKANLKKSASESKLEIADKRQSSSQINSDGKESAANEKIVTSTTNVVATQSPKNNDSSRGTVSVVRADEPIVNSSYAPASKQDQDAKTGVIIDAGSGDSGELIIN
ncbi:hypothetical protein [uncultured Anaerobiospirillum sp.]|uniref:hypothetical protein n=1 Tax=uncultured Anaerobiospirillum sp. TaxID=265728 RepID=UPI0028050315|nr:hypothetical protein [uncultured Anaerobiospirillum sp.]